MHRIAISQRKSPTNFQAIIPRNFFFKNFTEFSIRRIKVEFNFFLKKNEKKSIGIQDGEQTNMDRPKWILIPNFIFSIK